jgi:YVTN family beta-propeller protein
MQWTAAAAVTAGVAGLSSCGNAYRPVVATVGIVGPAGQPAKFAVAVASPGPNANGLLTIVDFSGDTVLVNVNLGVNPYYFALNTAGTNGYTLNTDKTVTSFDISTSLISSNVLESTLPAGANPISLFATPNATYITDPGVSAVDQLTGSLPPALKQELPVNSGYTPVYVVGAQNAPRAFALTRATSGGPGQVQAIEVGSNTISATLPVGRGPIYGVMSADTRRVFVMNQTDGTVSVINSQTNALDTPVNTIPVGVNPVWADLAPGLNELVVANQGNGTTPGSLSIINIPLCSATTLPTNPNCSATNPIDATTFGQVIANVPLGINSFMVTVLADNTRAYVANSGDPNLPCSQTTCTVSVVNLSTNTVTATIPINGHPAWIASSNGAPTGKVYVVCHDSQVMTVIETDTDKVDTTIPLQGFGVSVRMTAP